ncbi:MAG: metal-dependent transcriptional regulator [Chloroflexota bacterium]
MRRRDLTPAMEDYLKAIYLLGEQGDVTVMGLAQALAVASPSVTGMVKRLSTVGLLHHQKYGGIGLTEAGEAVALEIVRHHRLLELYLTKVLGMPWEDVHAEADRLEHHISEDLEERIAAHLGQPTRDPHGDPIPHRDGSMDRGSDLPLSAVPAGAGCTVVRVPDGEPALLRYLAGLGLVPGAAVVVDGVTPYDDVRTLRIEEARHAVGGALAQRVQVKLSPAGGPAPNAEGQQGVAAHGEP